MNPILFSKGSTTFNTNGVGQLSPLSCKVTEERNSIFELEMTVKLGCRHFENIQHSSVILAKPSPSREPQPFRVYNISKPMSGKVKVKAEHIGYQLNYVPVMPFSSVNGAQNALNAMKANAAESCPFTFWTNISSNASYAIATPESIRHYLGGVRGSILDVFGGEYEWDNYTVKLHQSRGQNRGIVLRYGKNITDLKQEENIANTYTGICPYWNSTEGQLVTLPEKVIHASNASSFPFQRTIPYDFSDKFENAPTEAQLRLAAQSYVNRSGVGVPSVSIDVSFVDLSQTEEYKDLYALQTVELCDIITVEFAELGVSVQEKVTKTVYDVLSERYTKIGVGDVRTNLARTIEDQIDTVSYMPTSEQMQRGIDRATGVLNQGKMGHMAVNRNQEGYSNELLFIDEQSGGNLYLATNVLRLNMAGIGFSSNGYLGPYYQSWDMKGHLTLGGVNNSYGNFKIVDENAIPRIQMTKDGMFLWDIKAIGYYYNGVFYSDADHTTAITPTNGSCYFDLETENIYIYKNSAYTQVSGTEGLFVKLTHSGGLDVYRGSISGVTLNIARGNEIGLYCDGTTFQFGDFQVHDDYGRQVIESSDNRTGIGGIPDSQGGLYLWAGYNSDSDYRLAVNDGGIYTVYNGRAYNIGETLEYILANCCQGGGCSSDDCDNCDGYEGCDDEDCPGYGGTGCIPEGAECIPEECGCDTGEECSGGEDVPCTSY